MHALETLLTSTGWPGNKIIFISIRQLALFYDCNFSIRGQITEKNNRLSQSITFFCNLAPPLVTKLDYFETIKTIVHYTLCLNLNSIALFPQRRRAQAYTRNSSEDEIANVNFLYDHIAHALQNTIDSCINSARDRRGYCVGTQVCQSK